MDLLKLNQRLEDSHQEVILMSDQAIQDLHERIRGQIAKLSRACEGIAMLDILASFAQLVTTYDYTRPDLKDTIAIKAGRHPIRDKV
jgi:DNA mismatch repair protein MSH4